MTTREVDAGDLQDYTLLFVVFKRSSRRKQPVFTISDTFLFKRDSNIGGIHVRDGTIGGGVVIFFS